MCGNPECDKLTRGSNKYCSFRCRNVVINSKMDYTKLSKKFRDSYEEKPKICKNCGSKISYERHRENKTTVYCSNICGNISGSNFHKGLKRSVETRLNISKSLEIINDEKSFICCLYWKCIGYYNTLFGFCIRIPNVRFCHLLTLFFFICINAKKGSKFP
jgi:hypothetical protein